MIRYNDKKYSIEEVFSIIPINYIPKHTAKKKGIARINVDGALISQYSLRYETFGKALHVLHVAVKHHIFALKLVVKNKLIEIVGILTFMVLIIEELKFFLQKIIFFQNQKVVLMNLLIYKQCAPDVILKKETK